MSELSYLIKARRELLEITQSELASRVGMQPAQLCRIETGRTDPSLGTATRIADALGISLSDLLQASGLRNAPRGEDSAVPVTVVTDDVTAARPSASLPVRQLPTSVEKAARKAIAAHEAKYDALVGGSEGTSLQLAYPFVRDPGGAETLARVLRASLGAGEVTIADLPGLLDLNGVRIHLVAFRGGEPSVSFYDLDRGILSVAVQKGDTPERQTYRLAYELGAACVFASGGCRTIRDEGASHRFVRKFAAAFLMPEDGVRKLVAQCGITRKGWTYRSLLALKVRFNVSAEAFALRLEELGLIAPSLRSAFRDTLRAHYVAHPKAMEPAPHLPPLRGCVRLEAQDDHELFRKGVCPHE